MAALSNLLGRTPLVFFRESFIAYYCIPGEGVVPDRAEHLLRCPENFECTIEPRSREAETIVRATMTT
jgi:hypothetical protein